MSIQSSLFNIRVSYFLKSCFLLNLSILAGSQVQAESVFPLPGRLHQSDLLVPQVHALRAKPPKKLYAYISDKEFVAEFKTESKIDLVRSEEGRVPHGEFIYSLNSHDKEVNVTSSSDNILVFESPQKIKMQSDNSYKDLQSNRQWKVIQLLSNEGFHMIVQTLEGEKCVKHVDVYFHLNYGTESASKEEFGAAKCGKELN